MRPLDDTDLEILRLLSEDARRPFSDIGDAVDLSGPAVSDRVGRLREHGVIRGFTVDVDRSTIRDGTPLLIRAAVEPGSMDVVRDDLRETEAVEHVFTTVDGNIVVSALAPRDDERAWVSSLLENDSVGDYQVDLLSDIEWNRDFDGTITLSCAECGNTVTTEGTTARVGGDLTAFCCPSCESKYLDRYETLERDA